MCAGVYINCQLDDQQTSKSNSAAIPNSGVPGASEKVAVPAPLTTNNRNPQIYANKNEINQMVTKIQKQTDQPIKKQDLLKAGFIITRKLSVEEIYYLKKVALNDSCSQEEYQRAQKILLDKLSAEDINTLKKLGGKYGSNLKILSPASKT